MKRCIFLMAWLLCASGLLSAQNVNVVVRLEGKAMVRHKDQTKWVPLSEKDTVSLFDMISLARNSSVSVMKASTRAVYTFDVSAEPTMLYDIIKKAESTHLGVVRTVLKEAVTGNSVRKKSDFTSYGASVRGQSHDTHTNVVYAGLCDAINKYFSGSALENPHKGPVLSRMGSEGLFSLKVSNGSNDLYYVNVVCLDLSAPSFELCYPLEATMAVSPGTELHLPGEYQNDAGIVYMLVASLVDFDSTLLDMNLKKRIAPASECNSNLVYIDTEK